MKPLDGLLRQAELTADVRPEVRDRSEKEGIDGFLAKPVLLEDFADLLRRLEERGSPGS